MRHEKRRHSRTKGRPDGDVRDARARVMRHRFRTRFAADPETITPRGGVTRRAALGRLAGGTVALLGVMGQDTAQAEATPTAPGEAPNHVELASAETRITYDAATTGGVRLSYAGPYGSQTLQGDQVLREACALGWLVTGSLGAFPDQGALWLTLLLPRFNAMTASDAPVPFATVAILKWVISTIAGPPRTGALEEYRVVTLEGTAQVV
jgi:hypothetical protein